MSPKAVASLGGSFINGLYRASETGWLNHVFLLKAVLGHGLRAAHCSCSLEMDVFPNNLYRCLLMSVIWC